MSQVLYQVVFGSCLYALKLGEAPCTNTHPRFATSRNSMLPRTALVAENPTAVATVVSTLPLSETRATVKT